MGLLNITRRMHLRQTRSIREIARCTGLSRNTVSKHLAADTVEPKFATPERSSELDPIAEKLAVWLKTNAGKPRKERQTLKKMHAYLVTLGFTGSYNRVAAFSRDWRVDRQREQHTTGRGTFIPLAFRPGEAFQFDWSEDFAVVGGERTKLQVAHIKLSHSRTFLLRAYPLQTYDLSHRARMHGAAMAWMFDAHCATAILRSVTSPSSSILNSRLCFRFVISTLQLLGHDPVFVSTKPAAAQSAPSEVGQSLHHGKGTSGGQIRDDSVRFKAKSAAAAKKGRDASHALTPS